MNIVNIEQSDNSLSAVLNPIKRKSLLTMSFAAAVAKPPNTGHIVDVNIDGDDTALKEEQNDEILATMDLFNEDDLSKLNFDDSNYDGLRLRMFCSNDESRDWLLGFIESMTNLKSLKVGKSLKSVVLCSPPELITIVMDANLRSTGVIFID